MRHMKGRLAFSLLMPPMQARFVDLFEVASRRSVFSWSASALADAQVVVLDGASEHVQLQPMPPCVIWVGRERQAASDFGEWEGYLGEDFTVSDVIDILDRAAVFLLDWQARQRTSMAVQRTGNPAVREPVVSMPLTDQELRAQGTDRPTLVSTDATSRPSNQYHLQAWVFLNAPFDSMDHVVALELMTRQPVTAQQLQAHSGLTPVALVALLQELARRKVLQVTRSSMASSSSRGSSGHRGQMQTVFAPTSEAR